LVPTVDLETRAKNAHIETWNGRPIITGSPSPLGIENGRSQIVAANERDRKLVWCFLPALYSWGAVCINFQTIITVDAWVVLRAMDDWSMAMTFGLPSNLSQSIAKGVFKTLLKPNTLMLGA
jgi:hypothetical protein